MRGIMIGLGVELIETFHWVLYAMGAFLVLTGAKWAFSKQEMVEPEKNPVLRFARKILPVSNEYDGNKFVTKILSANGANNREFTIEMKQIDQAFDSIKENGVPFFAYNIDILNKEKRNELIQFSKDKGIRFKCILHSIAKGTLKAMTDAEHEPLTRRFVY